MPGPSPPPTDPTRGPRPRRAQPRRAADRAGGRAVRRTVGRAGRNGESPPSDWQRIFEALGRTALALGRQLLLALGALLGLAGRALARLGLRDWLRLSRLVLIATAPVWIINVSTSYFGGSSIFPFSPFFLAEKARAVHAYLLHRPKCLIADHPEFAPVIAAAERRHRLPRGLLAALIAVESNGHPHAISFAGAMGPGQLMPSTARLLGVGDPFDTEANIDGSARYLASQIAHFGSVRLALAAYNAGPGAVRLRVPRNGETEGYVDKVMRGYAANRRRPS